MQLGKMIGGILLVACGAGLALFVPGFLEKDANEHAAEADTLFDALALAEAKEGDTFIFSGKVSREHPKTFDHDIVVGVRMKKEQRKRKRRKDDRARQKEKKRSAWVVDDEFKQEILIQVESIEGLIGIRPYSVDDIEGSPFKKTSGSGDNEKQWIGIKAGQTLSVRGEVIRVNPVKVKVIRGQKLFVGTHEKMLKEQAKGHAQVLLIVRIAGGLLAVIGIGLVVFGVIRD